MHYDQANSRVTIPLPPLTMNQMLELSNAIIAKEKQIEKNMFAVKAQTGQQTAKVWRMNISTKSTRRRSPRRLTRSSRITPIARSCSASPSVKW